MSRYGRFHCEVCDEFWPDSYASEQEAVCSGCYEMQRGEYEDGESESDFDDEDDDFEDPFGDQDY